MEGRVVPSTCSDSRKLVTLSAVLATASGRRSAS